MKKTIRIIREKYIDYVKNKTDIINNNNKQWIYDIIDDKAESEKVIYSNDYFKLIPTYVWDGIDIFKLHLLAIINDKSVSCIRDLNHTHIPILKNIQYNTLRIIKKKYKLNPYHIKMYIHYSPSAYLFHIHFVNIYNTHCNSSCEYSYELNSVIFNLTLNSDYYKIIDLNKKIECFKTIDDTQYNNNV
jgi:m7GpppX diphosphatase